MPDLWDDRLKVAKITKARLRTMKHQQFYFENPVQYALHRYGIILLSEKFLNTTEEKQLQSSVDTEIFTSRH